MRWRLWANPWPTCGPSNTHPRLYLATYYAGVRKHQSIKQMKKISPSLSRPRQDIDPHHVYWSHEILHRDPIFCPPWLQNSLNIPSVEGGRGAELKWYRAGGGGNEPKLTAKNYVSQPCWDEAEEGIGAHDTGLSLVLLLFRLESENMQSMSFNVDHSWSTARKKRTKGKTTKKETCWPAVVDYMDYNILLKYGSFSVDRSWTFPERKQTRK